MSLENPLVTIIIPTYNEHKCINPLLDRIDKTLHSAPFTSNILIVDDASPDGTAEKAQQKAHTIRTPLNVHVRTENHGLAESIVDGLRRATGEICVIMDADLQHPPAKIPALVQSIQDGADVAVGSRNVDGGAYCDWTLKRKLLSHGADTIARLALPEARQLTDPMSGFFALRKEAVEIDELSPTGFKILLEIISTDDNLTVEEIGYQFGKRKYGESKLDSTECYRFLKHMTTCRVRTHHPHFRPNFSQLGRTSVIAGSGLLVMSLVIFFLTLPSIGIYYISAGVISPIISLFISS